MPIVLAHVGWPWHLEAVAMALHKSNVYLDISGWKYRYLPDEVRREMPRRLRGQFLFGTDYPMFDPGGLRRRVRPARAAGRRRRRDPARQRGRAARPVGERPARPATTGPRPAISSAGCAPSVATSDAAEPERAELGRVARGAVGGERAAVLRRARMRCWISVRISTFLTPWPMPPTK